jgi:tRNA(His) 5'-end guanylyltransferase
VSGKNELLFQQGGTNFNDLPQWEKRGWTLRWETIVKQAVNPKTDEPVEAERQQLVLDLELPMRDAFSELIRDLVL